MSISLFGGGGGASQKSFNHIWPVMTPKSVSLVVYYKMYKSLEIFASSGNYISTQSNSQLEIGRVMKAGGGGFFVRFLSEICDCVEVCQQF